MVEAVHRVHQITFAQQAKAEVEQMLSAGVRIGVHREHLGNECGVGGELFRVLRPSTERRCQAHVAERLDQPLPVGEVLPLQR